MQVSRWVPRVRNVLATAVPLVVVLVVGCGQRKPDLYGRETEEAWTNILREEILESANRQGAASTEAEHPPPFLYSERAWIGESTVSVIFTDENDPPLVVGAAQFRRVASRDGVSWMPLSWVVAFDEGGSLKTFAIAQLSGEPSITEALDSYLAKHSRKRQKWSELF